MDLTEDILKIILITTRVTRQYHLIPIETDFIFDPNYLLPITIYYNIPMSLSVAIVVHNEEKNIIRCLESVYDWVDEIVIVDGDSTDNTVKLIKKQDTKNKIQTIKAQNVEMFHLNKQKALE